MISRRKVFVGSSTTALALNSFFMKALAEAAEARKIPGEVELRGMDGRMKRLGTLDLESQQDFTVGFRVMQSKLIRKASNEHFDKVLAAHGVDPTMPIIMDEVLKLIENEPLINIAPKTWLANQQITWKTLSDYYHVNADLYLSEMEAADKQGPGSLELNPSMEIPQYARHEIHIQPGGYVGDEFAGHLYHYGTNSFYVAVYGHNEQDQVHRGAASRLPLPEDGKVNRILDMGCGPGQLTVALKERFPDAEVWGIDVGGPMVRYAHMRASDLGSAANFAQRLAEETHFPDNHFDIVTSQIMHHEMPAEISRKIVAEAHRLTRSGGVYYPMDFISGGAKAPARSMYARWWDHRWNNEVWTLDYHAMDFNAEIAKYFRLVQNAKSAIPGLGARHAVKV